MANENEGLRLFDESSSITLNDSCDPDLNFFNHQVFNFRTTSQQFTPETATCFLKTTDNSLFSLFNLNIRSISKNFESLKSLLHDLKFTFKAICLTETWHQGIDLHSNSKYRIPGYNLIHQARKSGKGGGVCIFVHESLHFKTRSDLAINCEDCESLSIEIVNNCSRKNVLITTMYRPPAGNFEAFEHNLKHLLAKSNNKVFYLAGDININLLQHSTVGIARNYMNTILQYNIMPIIDKPTRVTNHSSTLLDHILTNETKVNSKITSGVITTDVSDHFPTFSISNCIKANLDQNNAIFLKRLVNTDSIQKFRVMLNEANWELLYECKDVDSAYDFFSRTFLIHYNKAFPYVEHKVTNKNRKSPWMTKALFKSSKKKQRLYEKFLKKKTYTNECKYRAYKNLFEKIKNNSKKLYYSNKINSSFGDTKKTWDVIREITGKEKQTNQIPTIINDGCSNFTDKQKILEKFNDFFVNIGNELSSKIPLSKESYKSYLGKHYPTMEKDKLTLDELKTAFNTLKSNKSVGIDDIDINLFKTVFDIIENHLLYIFELTFTTGSFPQSLKIARITPIFKSGDRTSLSNYRPISILPCVSKLLERIMYNRLFKHLLKNTILCTNQFGFQKGHSTDHAVLALTNEILKNFDKDHFTLGVFVDLSKAFDTVNHEILIDKLEHYGIRNKNLEWFKSYLTNRKQCVSSNSNHSKLLRISCGVPQGSILGPLLFLLYINDLATVSNVIKTILFADDTSLFHSDKCLKSLFNVVNYELTKITEWFVANKLSLNTIKTKYILFGKSLDNIPLSLPKVKMNKIEIQRVDKIKFLGVLIDEQLNWKHHINLIENKISKNVGIMFRCKELLNKFCLKNLYYSFIHTYINYCNITWASTNLTKLNKIYNHQKHAIRIIMNESKYTSAQPLMKELGILSIYQINIQQNLLFMFKLRNGTLPKVFKNKFSVVANKYSTRQATKQLYSIPKSKLKMTDFTIEIRAPKIRDSFAKDCINITSYNSFKSFLKFY